MSSDFQTLLDEARSLHHRRVPTWRGIAAKVAAVLPEPLRFRLCALPGGIASGAGWKKEAVSLKTGEGFLATVENGVACDFGAHLTGDGLIIPELSQGTPATIMEQFLIRQKRRPEVPHRAGPLISLAQAGDRNFFRWMYEVLPRWQIIKSSRLNSSGGVYACLQNRFHRESLNLLGLVPSRVVDSAAQPFLRADVLHVPSFVHGVEPWITQWLRDSLLAPALKQSSLHTRKRIYISRKQVGTRQVANEAALVDLLKRFEFTEICLEDYSLAGQIALFHAAQAIVAPHGAGLTNLTFCESGASVLELIADGLDDPIYEKIAAARGLRYQSLRCAPSDASNLPLSHITVDLDAVKDALGRLI